MSREVASWHNQTLMFLHLPVLDVGKWASAMKSHNWHYVDRPITFVGSKPCGYNAKLLTTPLANSGTYSTTLSHACCTLID